MLYVRGRQHMISTLTATQKFNATHPFVRVKATELYVYRLRNTKDLDTFIDEVSAVFNKKSLIELYYIATSEPYSFLYVILAAKDKNKLFYQKLESEMSKKKRRLICSYFEISYIMQKKQRNF